MSERERIECILDDHRYGEASNRVLAERIAAKRERAAEALRTIARFPSCTTPDCACRGGDFADCAVGIARAALDAPERQQEPNDES